MDNVTQQCPHCGHTNHPTALICEYCTQTIEHTTPIDLDAIPLPAEEPYEHQTKTIPFHQYQSEQQTPTTHPYASSTSLPDISTIGTDSVDPLLGTTIGNYQIQHKIASGGFGAVYYAKHSFLQQVYAIKILHLHHHQHDIIERFKQEANILAQMSHPNVVRMFDFGTLPNVGLYMVMEYLEGTTLYECILQRETFGLNRICQLCEQICGVLSYVCAMGIVHRDLKPGNIFLCHNGTPQENVKLIDFGIASILYSENQLTQAGSFVGTAKYGSPEQIRGSKQLDVRSDLYSLGVVLYRLLTGREPFLIHNKSLYSVIFQHLNTPPPPLAETYPEQPWAQELEAFFQKCLAKQPEERYDTPERFYEAFRNGTQAQMRYGASQQDTVRSGPNESLDLPPQLEQLRKHPEQLKAALKDIHEQRQKKLETWLLRGVENTPPVDNLEPQDLTVRSTQGTQPTALPPGPSPNEPPTQPDPLDPINTGWQDDATSIKIKENRRVQNHQQATQHPIIKDEILVKLQQNQLLLFGMLGLSTLVGGVLLWLLFG